MSATLGDPRLPARFWAKVSPAADGCWRWTGANRGNGYGAFSVGRHTTGTKRVVSPHRLAYVELVGAVPGHVVIDHLCHNADKSCPGGKACLHRLCVNPAHLDPTDRGENNRRSGIVITTINAAKTHCMNAHPLSGDNLYRSPNGRRGCRACRRAAQLARAA